MPFRLLNVSKVVAIVRHFGNNQMIRRETKSITSLCSQRKWAGIIIGQEIEGELKI